MSRTRRSKPTSWCWMRSPRHARTERQLEAVNDALVSEGLHKPHRQAIPPNALDDLFVSHIRGQEWSRR